jgi:hypothetical protein
VVDTGGEHKFALNLANFQKKIEKVAINWYTVLGKTGNQKSLDTFILIEFKSQFYATQV